MNTLTNKYRRAVSRMNQIGTNFRKLRYGSLVLSLNPKIEARGAHDREVYEPAGLFFDRFETWVGMFEVENLKIPPEAFLLGAEWEFSEDDGSTWQPMFILSPAMRTAMHWQFMLARRIAEANISVTYTVGLGTYTVIGGNQVEDTTTAEFTAAVTQQNRPLSVDLPGVNAASLYVEGYHVSPQYGPPEASFNVRLPATMTNPGGTINGEFIWLPVAQPSTPGNSNKRGDLIRGFFIIKGGC